ncbi:hypothetical protein ACIHAR_00165 [Streptomyces sp. NPDC052016]|uniref:hypothetical protein n=1 Tax=Streptomyces sp. NPDC052016 TaxID=3365680 RepID=UPI0037D6B2FE
MSEQSLRKDARTGRPVQKRSGRVGAGDEGYSTSLRSRHVDVIAIGGTRNTGLLLGSGGRLARTTPGADA